ncbi:hypothetical protein AAG906_018822 [Vitis piasezkii]
MVVAEDGTRLKKIMEQERVFELLAGLNPELDQVRGLPSIREVYAYVIGKESHRVVMLGGYTPENSALTTAGNFKSMGSKLGSKGGSNRAGKPVTRSGQAHQAATIDVSHENISPTEQEPILLSKEHYEKLKTLLNQLDTCAEIPTAKTDSCSYVQTSVLPQPVNVPNASTSNTSSSPTVQDVSGPKFSYFASILPIVQNVSTSEFSDSAPTLPIVPNVPALDSSNESASEHKKFQQTPNEELIVENLPTEIPANELEIQFKEREHMLPANTSKLKVYSRKGKSTTSSHIQSSNLKSCNENTHSSVYDDLYWPIALRKGTRKCTQHSYFKFYLITSFIIHIPSLRDDN